MDPSHPDHEGPLTFPLRGGPAPAGPIEPAASSSADEELPLVRTVSLRPGEKLSAPEATALPVARLAMEEAGQTLSLRKLASTPPPPIAQDSSGKAGGGLPSPEATDGPPDEKIASALFPCPRCGTRLINPSSLGFCSKCGYCRLLEQESAVALRSDPRAERKLSLFGLVEFIELLARVPPWLLILAGGVAGALMLSLIGYLLLPAESGVRHGWAVIQFVVGGGVLFTAQVWALALVAPKQEKIGFKDWMLLSGSVWGGLLRRLPESRWPIWLACWGLALVVGDLPLLRGVVRELRETVAQLQTRAAEARALAAESNLSSEEDDQPVRKSMTPAAATQVGLHAVAGTGVWVIGKWVQWQWPPPPPPEPEAVP